MKYLMIAYPLIATLGAGTGVLAMFYYFINLGYTKLRNHFMSSISLKYNDETFKWVLKYLHDE
jgi:hypothetical protein